VTAPSSVAIVTGASQGIGRATALRLARDFGVVVLVARDQGGLDEAAVAVRGVGAQATTRAVDLHDPQSATAVIDGTLQQHGRIDALLNIAGAVPQINLFDMTDAQWDDGMAVKFHGARRLTMRAWDALKASRGSVVFMSGGAALHPAPANAAVAAINAAITAMAKAFAEQGIVDGVQVNSVLPGMVLTERLRAFFQKWAPAHQMTVEAAIAAFPARVGSARLGTPEDIADLMAYLVSPAAKWMTGTAVRMDGGEIKGV
jgi:NAD(P)-dependent dehydrogenase (short-subunit alcohol dehydrogenase family)